MKHRGPGEGDAVLSTDVCRLGQTAFRNCLFLASGCRLPALFFPKRDTYWETAFSGQLGKPDQGIECLQIISGSRATLSS